MKAIYQFAIKGKPTGKARHRSGRYGMYSPKSNTDYEHLVQWSFKLQNRDRKIITGAIAVDINAYFAIPKRTTKKRIAEMHIGEERPIKKPDADNISKIILDALNKLAWADDAQVVECTVKKWWSTGSAAWVDVQIKEV